MRFRVHKIASESHVRGPGLRGASVSGVVSLQYIRACVHFTERMRCLSNDME